VGVARDSEGLYLSVPIDMANHGESLDVDEANGQLETLLKEEEVLAPYRDVRAFIAFFNVDGDEPRDEDALWD
jgi:hypothetical protein